jgi:hypothetical protein
MSSDKVAITNPGGGYHAATALVPKRECDSEKYYLLSRLPLMPHNTLITELNVRY